MLDLQIKALRRHENLLSVILLSIACYALFFHGLGNIGLLGPDEPRYSSIAHEMLRSGDFITPRLNGSPWYEKPVLMYWGAAIGYAVFGVGEFGARFPSALGATLCVFMVYISGARLWDRRTGLLAALVMASSIGFYVFARAASMDMLLTACLTMALCSFMVATNSEDPVQRRRWFQAFYAFIGLGVLAKGPVAIVLPACSLFGFLLLRRRLSEWKTWHPQSAWISIAIAAPWYIACTWANGAAFPKDFFVNHNIHRFTTNLYGHPHAFYFYFPVLLMWTLPWTFLLISALRRRFDRNDALLAWWIVVPMVFFSVSNSKLPGYILPVVPPVAMLCARELRRDTSRLFRIAVLTQAGTMIFIGVAFGFFSGMLTLDPHVDGMAIAAVSFVLAGGLIIIGLWLKPPVLAVFNLVSMVTLVFMGVSFILPRFDQTDTMRPWSQSLVNLVPNDQMVYLYKPARWSEFGLQYYRSGKATAINSPDQLIAVTGTGSKVLCIADNKTLDEVAHIANVEMKVVLSQGNQTAFLAWRSK